MSPILEIDPEEELFGPDPEDEEEPAPGTPIFAKSIVQIESPPEPESRPFNVERIPQDVDIDKFVLDLTANSKGLSDLGIRDRIQDGNIQRTIEGASNITVSVNDYDFKLEDSGVLKERIDVKIDDYWYRLQAVNRSGDSLELVFVDRDVARIKREKSVKRATRGAGKKKMTRAEFCFMLVRLVKGKRIRIVCPELHKIQSQAKPKREITKERTRDKGLHIHGRHKIIVGPYNKAGYATKRQLRYIERVIEQGYRQHANEKVITCALMVIQEETGVRNFKGGDRDSVGLFQQRPSQGWPGSGDVERDARAFYNRAISEDRKHPSLGYGELCQKVQASGFPDRFIYAKPYALRLLDAYGGEGSTGRVVRRVRRRFTTESDGKAQNWWDAIGRLMDEVGWRRFMSNGVLYLISEEDLFRSKPRFYLSRKTDGVHQIDYEYDVGQPTSEVTITATIKKWTAPPGTVVKMMEGTPAKGDGRWLVSTIERNIFNPIGTITLKKPRPELAEPADDTRVENTELYITGTGRKRIDDVYRKMKHMHEKHYPYIWGGGHPHAGHPSGGGYDCSGGVAAALVAGGFYPENKPVPRSDFLGARYAPGRGKFLTIWSNAGHVFIEIKRNGKWVHFGTGDWGKGWSGIGINTRLHFKQGFKPTHPKGF